MSWKNSRLPCWVLAGVLLFAAAPPARAEIHAFYYPWYGTPEQGGQYRHWNHQVLSSGVSARQEPVAFAGGENIGADFYPQGGCYSSADPLVQHRHMEQMARAGVQAVSISWLGVDSPEAAVVPGLLDAAAAQGLKVNFHLEPAVQGSVERVRQAVFYLIDHFGHHPAFYRSELTGGLPLFYVYDSYRLPTEQWARLLTAEGDLSLRATAHDAVLLGLHLNRDSQELLDRSGFDGGYSYFAVDGFSHGASSAHWPALVDRARREERLFVPAVGPGYADLRIRPWNGANQRDRMEGATYDCLFARAIASKAPIITVTSFNEWHEGTQIEPAIPFATADFTYQDYGARHPGYYLERTAYWAARHRAFQQGEWAPGPLGSRPCGEARPQQARPHAGQNARVTVDPAADPPYDGGPAGTGVLLDGRSGSLDHRNGGWLGFEGTHPVITLSWTEPCRTSGLEVACLANPGLWVFPPRQVRVEGLDEQGEWLTLAEMDLKPSRTDDLVRHLPLMLSWPEFDTSGLRLTIIAQEECPRGHPGAGKPAWIFVEEIRVRQP
jgi:glycoprotein endo-alpha-1,2-mannosidase